ncbi:Rv3654c family TadE-like protein [Streptomyces parvus]|uniref:Rv3654c family TadE-like protein n=1 Tax=Streptomyces parvus TaxID=66428 RepID=UPI0036449475
MRARRAGGWEWGVLGRGMFWGWGWGWGRCRGSGGGADRGVATVWAAVTVAGLCTVFAVVLALGQAVAARHRAGGAADLAALAAADRALEGAETACAAARRVAVAQDAVVVRCAVQGEVADVTARSGFGPYLPTVRARAGPPASPSGRDPADAPGRPPADPSGDAPADPSARTRAGSPAGASGEPRAGP